MLDKSGIYTTAHLCPSLIYDEFSQKFIDFTKQLKVGDPFLEETDIRADDPSERDRTNHCGSNQAVESGAKIGCGGKQEGNVFLPTVLLDVNRSMDVVCQEAFAPIVASFPIKIWMKQSNR